MQKILIAKTQRLSAAEPHFSLRDLCFLLFKIGCGSAALSLCAFALNSD
jgi:hypothetical protein